MNFELTNKQIEDIYNVLNNAGNLYNETFEMFKKQCKENGIEFEKHSFDYFIKDDKHLYKKLNNKIVREVVDIINNHIKFDFTYTTEYIEEVTLDELCERYEIDEFELCGILFDIEGIYEIRVLLEDVKKMKYFREIIYFIEEKIQENGLLMYL